MSDNATRITRARQVMALYAQLVGEDFPAVSDLMADLLHLAADLGDDEPPCVEWADDVIDRARTHFTAEVNGED